MLSLLKLACLSQEAERLAEEKRIKEEEEEQKRMEEEQLRLLEESQQAEHERLRQAIEVKITTNK